MEEVEEVEEEVEEAEEYEAPHVDEAPVQNEAPAQSQVPAYAEMTAAKMPSTKAAGTSRVSVDASDKSSRASSALSTAEPRYMITTTPSPSSAATMASATRAVSVPRRSSEVPAAISTRGAVPCSISRARLTAARARSGLWETTTIPTMFGYEPANSAASASKSKDMDAAPGSM